MFLAASLAASIALVPAFGGIEEATAPQSARRAKPAAPVSEREYATGPEIPKLRYQQVLPNLPLVRPVQVFQRPGDAANLYIIEQPGRILIADPSKSDTTEATVALDIRERVNDQGNEEGLLSAAFHPDFPKKRELYLYYTAAKPRRSILSRFTVSEDGKSIDPATEEVILTQSQPYSNHNGGTVAFGPDGMLYLSVGDGGAADDPHHYGQNLGTFLGKVLRVDVNKKGDNGAPYAVPADNPFVGKEGAKPEIWAYGTRNIWRMAFDPKTGQLWAGDVGQNEWEEISLIEKGGNYGWNAREGFHPFARGKGDGPFVEPVVEYSHREGLSVTGGVVYRGTEIAGLDGVYIYGDFAYGTVWGIRMIDGKPTKPAVIAQRRGELISSIDAMKDGTVVLSTFNRGQDRGNPGSLWKLVAAPK
ncbi:MAG: Quinoprotein glucose dehydrogenase precursor [Planctomycetota bacterium]|jgi:glucose/arabinose dehydrogenase